MSVVDMPDRLCWSSTGAPRFTVTSSGQLAWSDPTDVVTDHERRACEHGEIVLHHVWSHDGTRLQRLVVEATWTDGPMIFAEARRPRTGWIGDELGRLLLAVLTCGYIR